RRLGDGGGPRDGRRGPPVASRAESKGPSTRERSCSRLGVQVPASRSSRCSRTAAGSEAIYGRRTFGGRLLIALWTDVGRRPRSRIPRAALKRASSGRIDDDGAVDAMHILRVPAEKRWRVILGPSRAEAIVSTQPPAVVRRIPLHPAANVAEKEGLIVRDPELRSLEHREPSHSTDGVRNHRMSCPR